MTPTFAASSLRRRARSIDWSKWLAPILAAVAIGVVTFAASWGASQATTSSLSSDMKDVRTKVDSIDRRTARIEGRLGIAGDDSFAAAGQGGGS